MMAVDDSIEDTIELYDDDTFIEDEASFESSPVCFELRNEWSVLSVSDVFDIILSVLCSRLVGIRDEGFGASGLLIRGREGNQVELEVSEGASAKVVKLLKISGDDVQYCRLCDELMNCLST